MSSRLVEVFVQDVDVAEARSILESCSARLWQETVPDGREKFSAIVLSHDVENLLKHLSDALREDEGFVALVLELQAIVPPLQDPEIAGMEKSVAARPPTALERFLSRDRRSTDEIYDDVVDSIALTPEYLITVILSALIAALGMRSGQTAIVIGAMVIAPLLGPTLSLALAATVGNGALAWRAGRTLFVGAVCVLIFTTLLSFIIDFDPRTPELYNRTMVHLADIALALASGAAGVLALNKGASSSLVGVMIAAALGRRPLFRTRRYRPGPARPLPVRQQPCLYQYCRHRGLPVAGSSTQALAYHGQCARRLGRDPDRLHRHDHRPRRPGRRLDGLEPPPRAIRQIRHEAFR
jgi:uncharacterized hydrophobic protein (TIGR00341 family)